MGQIAGNVVMLVLAAGLVRDVILTAASVSALSVHHARWWRMGLISFPLFAVPMLVSTLYLALWPALAQRSQG